MATQITCKKCGAATAPHHMSSGTTLGPVHHVCTTCGSMHKRNGTRIRGAALLSQDGKVLGGLPARAMR